jgi:FMN phosphatase YigB (HAD superfamily)
MTRAPDGAVEELVFLFDVDNTLLDNDRVTADMHIRLEREVGRDRATDYFRIFESLREELGYADYLGALQRYRDASPRDPHVLYLSQYLIDYPFANRLYPESLDVIDRMKTLGTVVILSDGDVVFQPRKIERSGLWAAVDGHVLIYVHKEQELDDVVERFPADHYVLVDDKLRILTAVKRIWGERVTTVFVRQGHYAHDPRILAECPPADLSVSRIGGLLELQRAALGNPSALSARRAAEPRI